ncbi:type VII secretion protein EssC [Sporosarcina sp. HYO08]|uniref:type VII secretion protein EssC n=1 Tax=Sporosarcina sp. HYO08 TaxID=1759557 RepID=UPI0007947FE5|nr:type VII secretion protein EssC [Sporosarcina sp. HYO08]KXH78553.1 type VII secretion protein EssC [Sporosarcina sp. HYO08]
MLQLWLFYDRHYQRLEFNEYEKKQLSIGNDIADDITMLTFPFPRGPMTIDAGEDGFFVSEDNQRLGFLTKETPISVPRKGRVLHLYLTSAWRYRETFYIGFENEITFGLSDPTASISQDENANHHRETGSFSLLKTAAGWQVQMPPHCPLYLNGEQQEGNPIVEKGDVIQWAFMEVKLVDEDVLEVLSVANFHSKLPEFDVPQSETAKVYPAYRRTPRMIYDLPEEKVSITFPSQESEHSGRGLWLIITPPLVMLIVLGLVAFLIPRGVFIIISLTMFMMTLVTSTVQYFREKKRRKLNEEKRRRVYTAYLKNMREELYALSKQQKDVLDYHFPSFERMKHMTNQLSGRIWEKTMDSHDLLEFRLGTGNVPSSYDISLATNDLANREVDDLLEQSQRMETAFKEIPDAPITAGLSQGIVGLIGKEAVIKRELHQLIGQLAFFHSYHDVRMIHIFNHTHYAQMEWMKWLPHFTLPHMHAKGLIHNEQTRDQLLSRIYEMIRERDVDENKGKVVFTPHLVFIVSDYQLLAEHVILEYLEGKDHAELGISVIFAASAKERMTENVHTLIQYVNEQEGEILIDAKKAVRIPFRLDPYERATNERFARMLKTLNHQVGITNSIPNSVGFLEMFDVNEVEDLPIEQNWLTNESAKSLAVPVGFKGKTDLVELNLHEKAHGPHGLLAGTTGSGKSEFLQTYILSLAVNFHPHEVAFLLIDYKGGGMAQPFRHIPHLLGTITNIEGSKNFSMRALASINSELKRRQRLFDTYTVTHIDDYTTLYKEGKAEEPLPHLFLISDEFAELKSEEPDFIRELVSTARIGRSLGVHLILATQKPGGIIDDQIWSNARFRVALKVQDASDSKEILKNADAASITVTGRGYLQVGNNEVYELFQSAWSGAPYMEETVDGEDEIAIVTDLGYDPLSEIEANPGKKKTKLTEIEAVTAKIAETQRDMDIQRLPSPWLPPLPFRIASHKRTVTDQLQVPIGMIDEPEKQRQTPIMYHLMSDGNLGVFGSSGYGKSYTLLTALLGIADNLSPAEANFYILDYGNGSLLPLRQLPHTADYFTLDEELKRDKLVKLLKSEIAKRKMAFQQAEVSNINMYNEVASIPYPLLYIVIDNYDIVREEMEDFEIQMNQLGRDGQSLGIYLFISATRALSVRQSLMNNLKTKIVHYLMDASEAFTVVGRVPFDQEPFPGRAVIKKEASFFSQIYLPAEGDNDFEVLESVKKIVQTMKRKYYQIDSPKPIPMLPHELTTLNFVTYLDQPKKAGLIPIGLDEETVQPIAIDFQKNRHCLLIGQAQRGKTNMLKWMIQTIVEQEKAFVVIFDSFERGLSAFAHEENIDYLETKEQLTAWLTVAEQYFSQMEQIYVERMQRGEGAGEIVPSYFVIDGYSRFLQVADIGIQDRLSKMMKNYTHLGFNVIVSGNNAEITKGYDAFTNELKLVRQALIFMKKSEQTLFSVAYERREQELPIGYAHYLLNGNDTKVLTPLCKVERKIMQ